MVAHVVPADMAVKIITNKIRKLANAIPFLARISSAEAAAESCCDAMASVAAMYPAAAGSTEYCMMDCWAASKHDLTQMYSSRQDGVGRMYAVTHVTAAGAGSGIPQRCLLTGQELAICYRGL
jgi:hypothetical protein